MTIDSQAPSDPQGGNRSPGGGRDAIPQSIGKYRIKRQLGEGGMGQVYLALDTELNRHVALKLLRQERADNPTLVKRFHAEAKTAAALKHKHVVAVYEAGQLNGFTFIAMEFVDGIDVHDLVQRREVIPVRRSIDIVRQVASALQHAYERGVVHRDIKPSNMLIQRDGTVKLADLGLARIIDEASDAGITRDGTTVGTVDYMSPEQARSSRSADVRSDIYSLGCAWYHMLTGEPPYADGGLTQRLRLHAVGKPPDPRDVNPKVPEGIVAILNRMMAKKPEERYGTPAEVIKELDKVNLQRSAVAGQILAELDNDEDADTQPTSKARKNAAPLPARDQRLAKQDSEETFVFPVRLIGTVLGGIALLALAVYGWSNWVPSAKNEPVNIDFTGDPFDARDPFATPDSPDSDTNEKQDSPPDAPPDGDVPEKTPADDPSAAITPVEGEPVAPVEPTIITPADRAQARRAYLPEWAARAEIEANRNGLATATVALPAAVGPNARPPTTLLKPYLDQLPKAGGILVLPTSGPYELNLDELREPKHVVIKAGSGQRPAVFIRQRAGQSIAFNVSTPTLELDGLDLFFQVAEKTSPKATIAIHAVAGDLFLRNCSFQVQGNALANVVAIQIAHPASAENVATRRLLIQQCAIVGSQLTAVSVDADTADIVVRDSLLVAGDGTAIRLAQSGATGETSQRSLGLIGDTIVSRRHAVELFNGPSIENVSPTHVTAVDTVFANTNAVDSAAMLAVRNWPRTAGRFDNLEWESAGSAYQGWSRLVQRHDAKGTETIAADYTDWKQLWPTTDAEVQFHPTAWPASAMELSLPPDMKPFAPDTFPNTSAASLLGDRPGCRLEELHVGTATPPVEARDIPPRPAFPSEVDSVFENAEIIPVDLNKQDLGRFLSKTELPQHVVIVAEGFGRRTITPFSVSGRDVRIEFRQKGGDVPLKLAVATKSRASTSMPSIDALMTIEGGRLEIVGGTFELTGSASRQSFDWFMDVRNGGFSIERCYVASRPGDATPPPGLIRWPDQAEGESAAKPRVGVIRDSFLVAGGTLIQAQMRQRQLFVNNAILASAGAIFSLEINGPAIPTSSVVVQDSTLSAGTSFFEISAANPHDSRRAALGIFADRTIFGAPPYTGPNTVKPVLYTDRDATAQGQVAWIGDHNGYSEEIKRIVDTDAGKAPDTSDFKLGWIEHWGQENVRSPLAKPGGVLFTGPLPTVEQLEPEDFMLHRSAEANAWSGNRLGADPAMIASRISRNRR